MVEELEQNLQDAKNHYSTAQMEAETLRHSLHHELEMKAQIQQQMEEVSYTYTHTHILPHYPHTHHICPNS